MVTFTLSIGVTLPDVESTGGAAERASEEVSDTSNLWRPKPSETPEGFAAVMNPSGSTARVGRNDPCPCGSGKKFKRCCLDKDYTARTTDSDRGSLLRRNRILIEAVKDILELKKRTWADVKRDVSNEQVREVFQVVAYLWPTNTKLSSLLPVPDGKLRGLFLGVQRPESILANILRYSLYSDEIVIVSPFLNPHCIVEKHNPIVHPEQYKPQLLKLALMLLQLAPWIDAGIITMMPDPGDFDYALRKATWDAARERWQRHPLPFDDDLKEHEVLAKEDFRRTLARFPRGYLRRSFREFNEKMHRQIDDARIERAIDFMLAEARKDPLALEQPITEEGELGVVSSGANLEMGLYIAQLTGAYLFTNMKVRWSEILSIAADLPDGGEVWSPLTKAFQGLDFKFLDGVPLKFAYDIRSAGRLETLRSVLRKIWTEVGGSPDANRAEKLARDFGDELKQRVAEAQGDWEKIDRDLLKWAGTATAGGLAGIVSGNVSVSLAGLTLALVTGLLTARLERRRFNKTVPLSVFLDLKRTVAG